MLVVCLELQPGRENSFGLCLRPSYPFLGIRLFCLTIPWCSTCARSTAVLVRVFGITTGTTPLLTDSSSLTLWNSPMMEVPSVWFCGFAQSLHCKLRSVCVATLTLRKVKALGTAFAQTFCSYTSLLWRCHSSLGLRCLDACSWSRQDFCCFYPVSRLTCSCMA